MMNDTLGSRGKKKMEQRRRRKKWKKGKDRGEKKRSVGNSTCPHHPVWSSLPPDLDRSNGKIFLMDEGSPLATIVFIMEETEFRAYYCSTA